MNSIVLEKSVNKILLFFNNVIDELISDYKEPYIVGKNEAGYPIYNDRFESVRTLSDNYVIELNAKLEEFRLINKLDKDDIVKMISIISQNTLTQLERLNNIGEPHPEGFYSEWDVKKYISVCNSILEYCNEELKTVELKTGETDNLQNIPTNLEWDNQTEISELIYVLYKSKKIKLNGKPIEQKVLTEILCNLFNTKIKTPTDYLNKSATTYKKNIDDKTLMNELKGYIDEYNKRIIEKEK